MRALVPFVLAAAGALAIRQAVAQEVQPEFHHYIPSHLHASAMKYAREGDTGTALVLLERAHRIAPHDARIMRSLQALRAQESLQEESTGDTAATAVAGTGPAAGTPRPGTAEPAYPLWPKR